MSIVQKLANNLGGVKVDNDKKKKILNGYRHLESELQEKLNNYHEAQSKFASIGAQIMDDMPKSAPQTFDKIGEGLIKLEELKENYIKVLNERIRIDNAIAELENPVHRRVITLRYINSMIWEKIAIEIGYCWTQTQYYHSEALKLIKL